MLLLGHIDTVLRGEKFRRDGNRAFGTGTADMKAGNIVLLYALKALKSTGALKDARIAVMLTGDEESAGRPLEISRRDMLAAAKNSDWPEFRSVRRHAARWAAAEQLTGHSKSPLAQVIRLVFSSRTRHRSDL